MKFPITLRPAAPADAEFVDWLTGTVMSDYVIQTWSSIEARAEYFARNRFDPATTKIIQLAGRDIGCLSLVQDEQSVTVDNIQLLPELQRMGIGRALLEVLVRQCHEHGKRAKLQLLRVNPSRRLYERLGFELYGEDSERLYMQTSGPQSSV
ncbi:MAG: GNAT family N-acetyltransferase [Candidatus Obscuribacterales bacterium]|nr:GNAT family N-acetyltransferase [Candidatus Obscuribacterales bacterium]